MKTLSKVLLSLLIILAILATWIAPAWAFCGFYIGGANTQLFNQASQVIIARDGEKTILTMVNDFQGDVKNFALVVPVPTAIKSQQVHVANPAIVKKLDEFSQPRFVEYFDDTPCPKPRRRMNPRGRDGGPEYETNGLGVKVEESFKVDEYAISILNANDSYGLETWLQRNGYQLPKGAAQVLRPYIQQNMKFFVAKVDLQEYQKQGFQFLRPLQIAYRSPKFMLPIRLGMLNAQGDQDLLIYLLSPKGRIQVTNYRTIPMPTERDIPEYIKDKPATFGQFYQAVFQRSYERARKKAVFLEYAWNINSCDPCATEIPTAEELKQAGVFWPTEDSQTYITRLHVRYNRDNFPEDLTFQETANQEMFQAKYAVRHPYRKKIVCSNPAIAQRYQETVAVRQQLEAKTLADLTGWKLGDIQAQIRPFSIDPEAEYFWPW